jgi:nickel-dependent lactate racemase
MYNNQQITAKVTSFLDDHAVGVKRALIIIPDYTRFHSNAGMIANVIWHKLAATAEVDFLEALGTHVPMTRDEILAMYGDIPYNRFFAHNWRKDIVRLGEVPGEYIKEVSGGVVSEPIAVEVNARVLGDYDIIISIGQVVPHEVAGMANHAKNIFVGCGGHSMISGSHMLGAFCGLEQAMGKDHSPVRKVFDYAAERFLSKLPLWYIQTVTTAKGSDIETHGVFISQGREAFEKAVHLAQEKNITLLEKPVDKCVVYLDEKEFKSTWLGNKAIYRTRMAIADYGSLVVLAPGVDKFGEDAEIDALIRKYGYCGRENVIRLCRENLDLHENLSAAAHLIHGSSDGRFSVTYCTRLLTEPEVRGVGFEYMPLGEAMERYDPTALTPGFNKLADGEEVFYIPNPALGLWADKSKFNS